jgi:hypothetical protein
MKRYIKNENRNTLSLTNDDNSITFIPIDPSNVGYQEILQELERGEAELVPYVPPAPTWEQIRSQRDALLKDSDWSVAGDATPKPSKEAWLTYRQALRDLPQNFSEPSEVVWPIKPE